MAGNFGGQTHGNTAGTVEQGKRQACRQLARLFKGAVVVGNEVDGAFVKLVEQQCGDAGQSCLGVTHRGCTVTIARTEIALTIDQRVALAEVLRHTHHGIVGGLVAMRVVFAEHVPDNTRTFNRLGPIVAIGAAKAQPHARHTVQNAPLYWFLPIAGIRQRPAFDHAKGVFKVGTLGISCQRILVCRFRIAGYGVGGEKIHLECALGKKIKGTPWTPLKAAQAMVRFFARQNGSMADFSFRAPGLVRIVLNHQNAARAVA